MQINSATELEVYKLAYQLAMHIFALSRRFPPEERYALTGQIRRSSRSVCNNLREAWAKRRYEAYFVSKLTDCDGENNETQTSIDFAKDCRYITPEEHAILTAQSLKVGRMLGAMIQHPEKFLIRPHNQRRAPNPSPPKSDFRLPTSDFRLPTSDFRLPTSDF